MGNEFGLRVKIRGYLACGRINHKAKECSWIRSQITTPINEQLNRVRNSFNVAVGLI